MEVSEDRDCAVEKDRNPENDTAGRKMPPFVCNSLCVNGVQDATLLCGPAQKRGVGVDRPILLTTGKRKKAT